MNSAKLGDIVNTLMELDKTKNICSIQLQSLDSNSMEVNIIYNDYEMISEELWDYTLSFDTPELQIFNYGRDQEIPNAKEILYSKEE